jgi:DNA topoisomerase-1
VTLKTGRFGDYFELTQTEEEKEEELKPRRVSVPKGLVAADVTPEMAQKLIQLPRILGAHPENNDEVSTGLGRYGPFLKREKEYRNLESWERACEITFEEALEILKEPKPKGRRAAKVVLKPIGEVEGAEGDVNVMDGRYGPYVTDGKTNATLPRGTDPKSVTTAQAKEWLDAKRGAPKKPKRKPAAKKTKTTKKASKKSA